MLVLKLQTVQWNRSKTLVVGLRRDLSVHRTVRARDFLLDDVVEVIVLSTITSSRTHLLSLARMCLV